MQIYCQTPGIIFRVQQPLAVHSHCSSCLQDLHECTNSSHASIALGTWVFAQCSHSTLKRGSSLVTLTVVLLLTLHSKGGSPSRVMLTRNSPPTFHFQLCRAGSAVVTSRAFHFSLPRVDARASPRPLHLLQARGYGMHPYALP